MERSSSTITRTLESIADYNERKKWVEKDIRYRYRSRSSIDIVIDTVIDIEIDNRFPDSLVLTCEKDGVKEYSVAYLRRSN